jgi:hypothetical protein
MNVQKLENLLHASVAFSFVAGLLFAVAPPARADAADDWAAYREAHGLPVTAEPSTPSNGSRASKARYASLPAVVRADSDGNGEGEGNDRDARNCDPLLVEMARTDGDVRGETAPCK